MNEFTQDEKGNNVYRPARCAHCKEVISETLIVSNLDRAYKVSLPCPSCGEFTAFYHSSGGYGIQQQNSNIHVKEVGAKNNSSVGLPSYSSPTLNERQSTHGNYKDNARISQKLKRLIYTELRKHETPVCDEMVESLDMICLKLSRILSGNAREPDHWRDIAGYATLAEESCKDA